jgi:hypothetical protein
MRPDELLPTKRTLSIGSRVPPAVTSTRRPLQSAPEGTAFAPPDVVLTAPDDEALVAPESGALPEGDPVTRISSHTESSRSGSARRPTPCSPSEARRPMPGSTMCTPRARSTSMLDCVAACSYMWLFIAGATTTGQVAASAQLVSRLSASPPASFASVLAEAGAIR